MKKENNRKAIIIYGQPGAGKGTQAELLQKKFGFVHFDSGRYIENLVHSPRAEKDKILKKQQKLFDSGMLAEPWWSLKISGAETKKIFKSGYSIIYSGAPRTYFEAFGDKRQKGLMEVLKKTYGKKNVFIVWLKIKDITSIKRNSARRICSVCGLPVLPTMKDKNARCALCGGVLRTRTLDKPEIIKVRLKEFKERTLPILTRLKKEKYKIFEINGEHAPYKVSEEIVKKLKLVR